MTFETFASTKNWFLNAAALAMVGTLVSIKQDLEEIKQQLPLIHYRLEQLEQFSKSDKDGENKTKGLAFKTIEFIIPDRIKLETKTKIKHDNY
jgi:hypothetical protein